MGAKSYFQSPITIMIYLDKKLVGGWFKTPCISDSMLIYRVYTTKGASKDHIRNVSILQYTHTCLLFSMLCPVVNIYVHTDYWYMSHRSYSHIMRHWLNGTRQNYKVNHYVLNIFKVEIRVRNACKYNVETNTTLKNIVKVPIAFTICFVSLF